MTKKREELRMATQMAETPVLSVEDSKRVLEELKEVPTAERLRKLRAQYSRVNEGVRRERD